MAARENPQPSTVQSGNAQPNGGNTGGRDGGRVNELERAAALRQNQQRDREQRDAYVRNQASGINRVGQFGQPGGAGMSAGDAAANQNGGNSTTNGGSGDAGGFASRTRAKQGQGVSQSSTQTAGRGGSQGQVKKSGGGSGSSGGAAGLARRALLGKQFQGGIKSGLKAGASTYAKTAASSAARLAAGAIAPFILPILIGVLILFLIVSFILWVGACNFVDGWITRAACKAVVWLGT